MLAETEEFAPSTDGTLADQLLELEQKRHELQPRLDDFTGRIQILQSRAKELLAVAASCGETESREFLDGLVDLSITSEVATWSKLRPPLVSSWETAVRKLAVAIAEADARKQGELDLIHTQLQEMGITASEDLLTLCATPEVTEGPIVQASVLLCLGNGQPSSLDLRASKVASARSLQLDRSLGLTARGQPGSIDRC